MLDYIVGGRIAQRFVGQLLQLQNKRCDFLKNQTHRFTTTFGRYDEERDNNNKHTAHEGHNNTTPHQIYQASCERLVFSKATTTIDRPVYSHIIQWENYSTNQQLAFTRHNRFYCTAKTIRKKMVRYYYENNYYFQIFFFSFLICVKKLRKMFLYISKIIISVL